MICFLVMLKSERGCAVVPVVCWGCLLNLRLLLLLLPSSSTTALLLPASHHTVSQVISLDVE